MTPNIQKLHTELKSRRGKGRKDTPAKGPFGIRDQGHQESEVDLLITTQPTKATEGESLLASAAGGRVRT